MSQFTFFPAPSDPGYAQVVDDDSPTPNPIGSPVAIPAGTTVDVTAPHGTVDIVDSSVIPNTLYSVPVKSNGTVSQSIYPATIDLRDSDGAYVADYEVQAQEYINITIPDSIVTVNGSPYQSLKATQPLNIPVKDEMGNATGSKVGSDFVVPFSRAINLLWNKYHSYAKIVVDSSMAGPYTTFTQDAGSGTQQYRIGGTDPYAAGYATPTGTITLVLGTTLWLTRSNKTDDGTLKWQ